MITYYTVQNTLLKKYIRNVNFELRNIFQFLFLCFTTFVNYYMSMCVCIHIFQEVLIRRCQILTFITHLLFLIPLPYPKVVDSVLNCLLLTHLQNFMISIYTTISRNLRLKPEQFFKKYDCSEYINICIVFLQKTC